MPDEILVTVVSDHEDARLMYALVLSSLGFRVLTAETAEHALDLVRRCRPQTIVTDVRLPGASGLELTQQSRDDERTSEMAILFLTDDAGAGGPGQDAGADRFLIKPCLPDTLAREINTTVAKQAGCNVDASRVPPEVVH